MGLVQRMSGNNKTFAQLAESVLSMVLYVRVQSDRVDVVFEAYRQQPSIKDSERLNRGASTTLEYNCLQETQHTAVETIHVQFLQQDEPRQVLGWRVETTAIQMYAARQGIVCDLRRNLLQDDSR